MVSCLADSPPLSTVRVVINPGFFAAKCLIIAFDLGSASLLGYHSIFKLWTLNLGDSFEQFTALSIIPNVKQW